MLKVGCHLAGGTKLGESLGVADAMNMTAVQVFAHAPQRLTIPLAFGSLAEAKGVQLCDYTHITKAVHGPYTLNLSSDEKMSDKYVLKYLRGTATFAQSIGAKYLVFHTGSYQENIKGKSLGKKVLKRRMLDWLTFTEGMDVTMCLENDCGGGKRIGGLKFLLQLVKEVDHPRLRICFDSAHAFASGLDFNSKEGGILQKLESEYLPWIAVVHLNQADPDVICGKHRDRHNVIWSEGSINTGCLEKLSVLFQDKVLIAESREKSVAFSNIQSIVSGIDRRTYG